LTIKIREHGDHQEIEDLEIWQIARKLSSRIVQLTESGAVSKDYKFRDQITSSAGSIMDNIGRF